MASFLRWESMQELERIINQAFEQLQIPDISFSNETRCAIEETIQLLDTGQIRVAQKKEHTWETNQWVKKAILLYFKTAPMIHMEAGYAAFYDKVPLKYTPQHPPTASDGVRVVPHAIVRKGAYLAPSCILMPSYINIGAYVDSGTLIDTWATVGSCAQIGKNVHISGGAGIGGVLEPLQNSPTIIEDNCFIGARSEIVEGVIVEEGSVIAMGVFLSQSTPIYNRHTKTITYGKIPAGSVVVPGTIPSQDASYQRYSGIIVKQVDHHTKRKTAITELLREFS